MFYALFLISNTSITNRVSRAIVISFSAKSVYENIKGGRMRVLPAFNNILKLVSWSSVNHSSVNLLFWAHPRTQSESSDILDQFIYFLSRALVRTQSISALSFEFSDKKKNKNGRIENNETELAVKVLESFKIKMWWIRFCVYQENGKCTWKFPFRSQIHISAPVIFHPFFAFLSNLAGKNKKRVLSEMGKAGSGPLGSACHKCHTHNFFQGHVQPFRPSRTHSRPRSSGLA